MTCRLYDSKSLTVCPYCILKCTTEEKKPHELNNLKRRADETGKLQVVSIT